MPDLGDGDVVLLAEVQRSAGLAPLDEQLHPPLMLPMLQEEISCIAALLFLATVLAVVVLLSLVSLG